MSKRENRLKRIYKEKSRRNEKRNRGSATLEITLLMPMVLMILILILTMLISALQQAQVHGELMIYYADVEALGKKTGMEIYEEETELQLIKGYELHSVQHQVVRYSETQDRLRRWQVFEELFEE